MISLSRLSTLNTGIAVVAVGTVLLGLGANQGDSGLWVGSLVSGVMLLLAGFAFGRGVSLFASRDNGARYRIDRFSADLEAIRADVSQLRTRLDL